MIKKILKNVKKKNSKITFKYNQAEVIDFCKRNIAASILIVLVILFIAVGNAFVVGALIGGYIGAKRSRKLSKISSNTALILDTSIGAVLGGVVLISSVIIGSLFDTIGGIIGAVVGGAAILMFSGDIIDTIAHQLIKFSSTSASKKDNNGNGKIKTKKSKPRKKSSVSKRKLRLKST